VSFPETSDTEPSAGTTAAAAAPAATAASAAPDKAAPDKSDPWNDPRMPWSGRPRKADVLCFCAILLSGVYYYALLPFRAHLLGTHPVWSELLNGSTESIIAAAAFARVGHGTFIVALLAALPGLVKFDIIYWWAGRLWGDKYILLLSGKSQRGTKYMDRVHRLGRKFTYPAVILSPFIPLAPVIYVVAGWSRMKAITFLILDLIGNLIWAGLLCGLGYAIGKPAVNAAKEISKYGLWVTIGLVVVVVFFQMRSQRGMLRAAREAEVMVAADATADAAAAAAAEKG
jgi:membrane-associated protein